MKINLGGFDVGFFPKDPGGNMWLFLFVWEREGGRILGIKSRPGPSPRFESQKIQIILRTRNILPNKVEPIMAPLLPLLLRAMNASTLLTHHHHHHHHLHQNGHNCSAFALLQIKCWVESIGIHTIPINDHLTDPLRLSEAIATIDKWNDAVKLNNAAVPPSNSTESKTAKKESRDSAVSKVQSRDGSGIDQELTGPWRVFWDFVWVFEIIMASFIFAVVSARVGQCVSSRVKGKRQERREKRARHEAAEAEKWNILTRRIAQVNSDSNPSLPARPISNVNFFTIDTELDIGSASTPQNGVVDDEDLERGRPLRRFWNYNPRNPRPGRASSPIVNGNSKRKRSHDDSEERDAKAADLMQARTERHWGMLRKLGSALQSSSHLQKQRSANGESIPMNGVVGSTSRTHLRSECTLCEAASVCDGSEGQAATCDPKDYLGLEIYP